jgi:hypothetical protein
MKWTQSGVHIVAVFLLQLTQGSLTADITQIVPNTNTTQQFEADLTIISQNNV